MIKSKVFASLLLACLPGLSMAQSGDDLYFVPKKEQKKEVVKVVPEQTTTTTVHTAPEAAAVVVKDVKGNVRDVDEYNRRYTSRENTFSMQNDTLYIEEKPYGERGEWVNGFEGSQSDYEYAMRIVRFRSPGYAIPISSPLYWDVVYGALPSWDWNVFDDGMYAYVFPTSTNPVWWNWRFSWGTFGPRFGWSFGYLGIIILGSAVSLPTGTVVTMPAIGVVTGEAIGAVIGAPDGIRITDIGLLETGDTPIYVRDAIRLHTVELPVLL